MKGGIKFKQLNDSFLLFRLALTAETNEKRETETCVFAILEPSIRNMFAVYRAKHKLAKLKSDWTIGTHFAIGGRMVVISNVYYLLLLAVKSIWGKINKKLWKRKKEQRA